MTSFDPVKYWNEREHPNTQESPPVGDVEQSILPPLIKQSKSIFELGPGVGRLFPLYSGKQVTTLDISTNYSQRLHAAANSHGVDLVQHFRNKLDVRFPFHDDAFDLGIAAHVLYHVPFDSINFTVRELYRVSKKVFAEVCNNPKWPQKSSSYPSHLHVFGHDYEHIFEEIGIAKWRNLFPDRLFKVYILEK